MSSLKLINIFNVLKVFYFKKKKENIYISKVRKVITFTQTLSLSDVNLTMFCFKFLESYFNLII